MLKCLFERLSAANSTFGSPMTVPCLENLPILLANSMGQNRCGKICSHRSANSDKKRALVLSISTKIRGMIHSFLLVVISPAVSEVLPDTLKGCYPALENTGVFGAG